MRRALVRHGALVAAVLFVIAGAAALGNWPRTADAQQDARLRLTTLRPLPMEAASTAEPGLTTTTTLPPPPVTEAPPPAPPEAPREAASAPRRQAAPAAAAPAPAPAPAPEPAPEPAPSPPPPEPVADSGGASYLKSLLNGYRSSNGLSALATASDAQAKAQAHAEEMASSGQLYHSNLASGLNDDWWKLGENVGMGGSIDGIHDWFVNSGEHRSNMLDPAFTYVGVGVAQDGNGTYWVVEVFVAR